MTKNLYSEDALIEQTCIEIFRDQLGWEVANVYQGESFGASGSIGRDSEEDVILKSRFYAAIRKLNKDVPDAAFHAAWEIITQDDITKELADINFEKYGYLKDGIPVTFKNEKGEIIRNKRIKVFDLNEPENNDFLAVQQLWVEGKSKRKKRPDIVGFVNGIPLLFIELKAHHRKIKVAYEQNLRDYKQTIPRLFHCNAFVILSNGLESKIGSITSRFEFYHDWKRIQEDQEGVISLDTILRGTCEKSRFLDIFENFILFDKSSGSIAKLIARNHQYLGVNKAVDHFLGQREKLGAGKITGEEARKLGVFWHTQGSGKSYSMVFLCQKILRAVGGGYSFVLVTDRAELDKQIYATFAGVGAVEDKSSRASSGSELKEKLKTDKRYLFTLIHKFNFEESITDRDNIIVISDEAHRTQSGSLALNMRKALPNASFIGFTGTPLFKDDELTKRIFGDYVSTYNFRRSVEDGATVPLYYENRGEKLKLDNPQINDEIRQAIEDADLDHDQEDKLKKLFAREYPVLTSEKRLRAIAKDVVQHFNSRGYKGKGMFVAIDKVTAVKMYDFITEEWQQYITRKERELSKITDEQEALSQQRDLEWARTTEIGVVVSHEQNEIDKFEGWGLNIEPHREKMNTRDLEKEFKDEDHPFRLAIVCAMWITGFDVKSLSTLYLDKPLKSHTLMQTIARANRVHKGKNNGLIVDYIETYKALLEALAVYGDSGGGKGGSTDEDDRPVKPLEELIEELEEALDATLLFLNKECEFDLSSIIDAEDGLTRIRSIQDGYNAICRTDETRNKFGVLARELFKKYKALMPDESVYRYKPQRDAINAVYSMMTDQVDEADITDVVRRIQDVVNESIESLNLELEKVEGYGQRVDISGLDFKKIEEEFTKNPKTQNVAVQSLKQRVDKKLKKMLDANPTRVDYYERYQQIIDEYNLGKEYKAVKEIFDKLVVLLGDLSEEEMRSEREGLSEQELTLFDLLASGKKISDKDKGKLKETAKVLLESLQKKELAIPRWWDKTQTASAVRTAINNHLFENLPYPTYEDADISEKTRILYDYLKASYSNSALIA